MSDATFDAAVFTAGTGYTMISPVDIAPTCYYELSGTWTGTDFALWRTNWNNCHVGKVVFLGSTELPTVDLTPLVNAGTFANVLT